jgi:cobalt-zinc-cadmium resistance protein CzcA
MSLGAIDFGLIVDGAVIIVEATLHHLGLRKSTQGLLKSKKWMMKYFNQLPKSEVVQLLVKSLSYSLYSYSYINGIEGKMFSPMAMTVGFAIFGALILSLNLYTNDVCFVFTKNNAQKNHFG